MHRGQPVCLRHRQLTCPASCSLFKSTSISSRPRPPVDCSAVFLAVARLAVDRGTGSIRVCLDLPVQTFATQQIIPASTSKAVTATKEPHGHWLFLLLALSSQTASLPTSIGALGLARLERQSRSPGLGLAVVASDGVKCFLSARSKRFSYSDRQRQGHRKGGLFSLP